MKLSDTGSPSCVACILSRMQTQSTLRGRGETGRRARLRIWWGNPGEFNSRRPRHCENVLNFKKRRRNFAASRFA